MCSFAAKTTHDEEKIFVAILTKVGGNGVCSAQTDFVSATRQSRGLALIQQQPSAGSVPSSTIIETPTPTAFPFSPPSVHGPNRL